MSDGVDLDARVPGEPRDLDGCTGRRGVLEVAAVDVVDGREVGEIDQVDGGAHDRVECDTARAQHLAEVPHHLVGLGRQVAVYQLTRRGIQRNLTRKEEKVAG